MQTNPRIQYLDSLRGIAALAVFLGHYFYCMGWSAFFPPALERFPFSLMLDGQAAVSLFFVLSGLVLVLPYTRMDPKQFSLVSELKHFIPTRLIRICLPFFVALFLSYLAARYLRMDPASYARPEMMRIEEFWANDSSFRNFLRQLVLIPPAKGQHFIPQDWSLTAELKASLLILFFFSLTIRSHLAYVAVLLLFVIFRRDWFLVHFSLGIYTARHFLLVRNFFSERALALRIVFAAVFVFLYAVKSSPLPLASFYPTSWREDFIWMLSGVGAWGLIVVAIGSPWVQRWLLWKPFLALGRISYSFYLLQMIVIQAVSPRVYGWVMGPLGDEFAHLAAFLLSLAMVILLSAMSFRWVERPSLRLSHALRDKIRGPREIPMDPKKRGI